MPQDEWPPYRVGNPTHIHTLGVIASVYNLLEFRFGKLFKMYLGLSFSVSSTLFARINNAMRLDLTRHAIEYSSHPDSIRDDVRHFLAGFTACAENRNILMHSVTMFTWLDPNAERCPVLSPQQPNGVAFQKSPKDKPLTVNIYSPTIEELRGVADATNSFEVYGDRLYWHVLKNYEHDTFKAFGLPEDMSCALPERPAPPNLLSPLHPDDPTEQ